MGLRQQTVLPAGRTHRAHRDRMAGYLELLRDRKTQLTLPVDSG